MTFNERSLGAVCLSIFAILLSSITILQPYNNSPPIRSDGIGYHAWVHAIRRGSINFCKEEEILDSAATISMRNPAENKCGNKYPPGVGITQAPFTIFLGQYKTSQGFSTASNWIVLSLGSALLLGTVFITGKTLQQFACSLKAILGSFIAGIFGTGLLHYATYDGSFSHIYSAFFFACTLYIVSKKAPSQASRWGRADIISFAAFNTLLILIRQTNLLLILTSVGIAINNETLTLTRKKNLALASLLAIFLGLIFYLSYNLYHLGELTLSTYGGEKIVPIATHSLKVFLSYERGLFTYYPIVFLLITFGWITSKRWIFIFTLTLIIGYGLIYGSWDVWYLGGGFGHRGFVDMTPLMILSLGLTVDQISQLRWRRFMIPLVSSLAVICIYVTTTTQHAYWNSNYPFAGADQQMYWRTLINSPPKKK